MQYYELKLENYEISGSHHLKLPYESPCSNLHGHNWLVSVYIKAGHLAEHGMVLDFKHIKDELKKFDHKDINSLVDFNPTAENLAEHFGKVVLLQAETEGCHDVLEVKVSVQESEHNVASWFWGKE